MNPATHFLAGWTLTLPFPLSRRDRGLVTAASVAPDADGLGLLADLALGHGTDSLEIWSRYHHTVGHNVAAALAVAAACALAARRRVSVAILSLLAVHLHFLCDVAGSRGPDGEQWPIPYLLPFSERWQATVPWQWELTAWPNTAVTLFLLLLSLAFAWKRGLSPVSLFSPRADRAVVEALRGRFGEPSH